MSKLFSCLFMFLVSLSATASMVARESVKLGTVISTPSLPSEVRAWASFAQDVLGVKEVYVLQGRGPSGCGVEEIRAGIQAKIDSSPWQKLSISGQKAVREWRPKLEKGLEDSHYVDWIRFQLGETENAKKHLSAMFANEFGNVMKLSEAVYGLGGGPMYKANLYYNALYPLSSDSEKQNLDRQMQKMKVYLSKLPESIIET